MAKLSTFKLPPCVYVLYADGEPMYVGVSIRLGARIAEHERTKPPFDEVQYLPLPTERLCDAERALIAALQPPWNISEGPPIGGGAGERSSFGSIYYRADRGKWDVRIPTGEKTSSGRTQYRHHYAPTKRKAEQLLRELRKAHDDGELLVEPARSTQ